MGGKMSSCDHGLIVHLCSSMNTCNLVGFYEYFILEHWTFDYCKTLYICVPFISLIGNFAYIYFRSPLLLRIQSIHEIRKY